MAKSVLDTAFKRFEPYYDHQAKREVTSFKQEEKLMKQRGQVYTRDVKLSPQSREAIAKAQWEQRNGRRA